MFRLADFFAGGCNFFPFSAMGSVIFRATGKSLTWPRNVLPSGCTSGRMSPWCYDVLKEHLIHEIRGRESGLETLVVLWHPFWDHPRHLYLRQTAKHYRRLAQCPCVCFFFFFQWMELNEEIGERARTARIIKKLLSMGSKNTGNGSGKNRFLKNSTKWRKILQPPLRLGNGGGRVGAHLVALGEVGIYP